MFTRNLLVFGVVFAAGCSDLAFSDNIDSAYDFERTLFRKGRLEPRLVKGTETSLYLYGRDSLNGWTVEVEDESVLRVTSHRLNSDGKDAIEVEVVAEGVGTTRLYALNPRGEVKAEAEVEVAIPTRVELMAAGPLLAGRSDADAFTDAPQVLAGGMATFEVHYWRDGDRLWGNAVVSASGSDGMYAEMETTWLGEDRDWVQIQSDTAGPHTLALFTDDVAFDVVPVKFVAPDAIASVDLILASEAGARKEEERVVLAQAYDIEGQPIYGVEYAWDHDGDAEPGQGDLYRYEYDPKDPSDIVAHYEDEEAAATIHGEGYVDSSNNLGCQTVPVSTLGGAALSALLLRRRATRSAPALRAR